MSGRHRRANGLYRLGRRLGEAATSGMHQVTARRVALGSVLGLAVGTVLGRATERAALPPGDDAPTETDHVGHRSPGAPGDREVTQEVTGARLLAAWQASSAGQATTISDLSDLPALPDLTDPAAERAPVRLMGSMPGFSFWVGAEQDTPLQQQVQAVWDRTVSAELTDTLLRAINDWNRDHVWPTVWTIPSHTGVTVGASTSLDVSHGASDAQLVDHLDVSLAAIDAFFAALDTATTPPGDAEATETGL